MFHSLVEGEAQMSLDQPQQGDLSKNCVDKLRRRVLVNTLSHTLCTPKRGLPRLSCVESFKGQGWDKFQTTLACPKSDVTENPPTRCGRRMSSEGKGGKLKARLKSRSATQVARNLRAQPQALIRAIGRGHFGRGAALVSDFSAGRAEQECVRLCCS